LPITGLVKTVECCLVLIVVRVLQYRCLYCVVLCDVGTQEPIRIPSATMMLTDDVADDVSSLLVTKLMQTESSAGDTNSDHMSRRTVTSAAAAAAAANTSLADSVVRHADDGLADMSTQGATADNLHQLSLYICASFSVCCNLRKYCPAPTSTPPIIFTSYLCTYVLHSLTVVTFVNLVQQLPVSVPVTNQTLCPQQVPLMMMIPVTSTTILSVDVLFTFHTRKVYNSFIMMSAKLSRDNTRNNYN